MHDSNISGCAFVSGMWKPRYCRSGGLSALHSMLRLLWYIVPILQCLIQNFPGGGEGGDMLRIHSDTLPSPHFATTRLNYMYMHEYNNCRRVPIAFNEICSDIPSSDLFRYQVSCLLLPQLLSYTRVFHRKKDSLENESKRCFPLLLGIAKWELP